MSTKRKLVICTVAAVALVGAGEAVAGRVSVGDADVGEASELLINLFWRGLKGAPATAEREERAHGAEPCGTRRSYSRAPPT